MSFKDYVLFIPRLILLIIVINLGIFIGVLQRGRNTELSDKIINLVDSICDKIFKDR